jgi:hypothetical protein
LRPAFLDGGRQPGRPLPQSFEGPACGPGRKLVTTAAMAPSRRAKDAAMLWTPANKGEMLINP